MPHHNLTQHFDSILEDDYISPAQHADLFRRPTALTPEQSVSWAVFELAIEDYLRVDSDDASVSGHALRLRRTAELWLRSDSEQPMSFLWCCEFLEIDAQQCRERLTILPVGRYHRRRQVQSMRQPTADRS